MYLNLALTCLLEVQDVTGLRVWTNYQSVIRFLLSVRLSPDNTPEA